MASKAISIEAFNALAASKAWPIRFEEASHFDHPKLNEALALWLSEAGHGHPSRNAVTARKLKPFLPNVTLIERSAEEGRGRYRFKLVGTEISRLFGEKTGAFLEDAVPLAFVERWSAAYDAVFSANCPIRALTRFELDRVSFLDGETFFAPLRNEDGEGSVLLAATYMKSRTADRSVLAPA